MEKDFLEAALLVTFRVLNLTVLDRGLKMNVVTFRCILIYLETYLHSPTVTTSPTMTSLKQGDKWTDMFLCLFSNLKINSNELHVLGIGLFKIHLLYFLM